MDLENIYKKIMSEESAEQDSEIAQVINIINRDDLEQSKGKGTQFTTIDMNTELTPKQVAIVTKLETLVHLGVLPQEIVNIMIRKFKRNVVSIHRKGRKESIDIVRGFKDEERESGRGFFSKLISKPKE